jgi:hypothetical protein
MKTCPLNILNKIKNIFEYVECPYCGLKEGPHITDDHWYEINNNRVVVRGKNSNIYVYIYFDTKEIKIYDATRSFPLIKSMSFDIFDKQKFDKYMRIYQLLK